MKASFLLFFLLLPLCLFAQIEETQTFFIDHDTLPDIVYYDTCDHQIIVQLSSINKILKSGYIEPFAQYYFHQYPKEKKIFSFGTGFNRVNYRYLFSYDSYVQKIFLEEFHVEELGDAYQCNSGRGKFDFFPQEYWGDYHVCVETPFIQEPELEPLQFNNKTDLPSIPFEAFNANIVDQFIDMNYRFFEKEKKRLLSSYSNRIDSILIDDDQIPDLAYADTYNNELILLLTSTGDTIRSGILVDWGQRNYFINKKPGTFFLHVDYMRAGFKYTFKYNKQTKSINLIGYDDYAFGNVVNCGSGASSFNLLTGNFLGEWYICLGGDDERTAIKVQEQLPVQKIHFTDLDSATIAHLLMPIGALSEKAVKEKKQMTAYLLIDQDNIPDKVYYSITDTQLHVILSEHQDTLKSNKFYRSTRDCSFILKKQGTFLCKVKEYGWALTQDFTFRYEAKDRQIYLIGYDNYSPKLDDEDNCGTVKCSLNLLTGACIGNWRWCKDEADPKGTPVIIKQKLSTTKIPFHTFSATQAEDLFHQIKALYWRHIGAIK